MASTKVLLFPERNILSQNYWSSLSRSMSSVLQTRSHTVAEM